MNELFKYINIPCNNFLCVVYRRVINNAVCCVYVFILMLCLCKKYNAGSYTDYLFLPTLQSSLFIYYLLPKGTTYTLPGLLLTHTVFYTTSCMLYCNSAIVLLENDYKRAYNCLN